MTVATGRCFDHDGDGAVSGGAGSPRDAGPSPEDGQGHGMLANHHDCNIESRPGCRDYCS
eukprot:1813100-Rhodomonas_salina.4